MRIVWHGHACFEIANDELTVVTDPHDGKSIGLKPPFVKADIVLVSHDHFDHNKVGVVSKPNTIHITDFNHASRARAIALKILRSYHDKVKGERRGENRIFLFTLSSVNFCHLGDLGHTLDGDTRKKFDRPVDVLFVPVGGHFTIDHREAWEVVEVIDPKVVVPMHYKISGLSLNINDVEVFLNNYPNINRVGNEIDFDPSELEDIQEREIWLFSI